ncbi:MAG: mannosyltransferase family protein [Anaerolineales bacterium]
MKNPTVRSIVFIWLGWLLLVIGFQALATARLDPQWPDRAQGWTTIETAKNQGDYQRDRLYLTEPFMNNQVAWDSEYYLGIAIGGYDDLNMPALSPKGWLIPNFETRIPTAGYQGEVLSLSYAFLPLYPYTVRLVAIPLSLLGMNPIATATLAGVIISALGTLAAMLALYILSRDALGEEGGLRAAFYLVIFPTGFFLAQVYTEGLFVGLAFSSLAMLKRRNWWAAALLACAATLTRAVGIALIIPMVLTWLSTREWYHLDLEWRQIYHSGLPLRPLLRGLLAFSPLFVFLVWKFSYLGVAFDFVEANFFGRGYLDLRTSFFTWATSLRSMLSFENPQHSAYYFTEFFGMTIAAIAILRARKTFPELAWFSLAVFLISWGSGPAQGIHRYVLAAPALFVQLSAWGKNPAFDRVWTIASLLLMGLLAMLFAFNFWVA